MSRLTHVLQARQQGRLVRRQQRAFQRALDRAPTPGARQELLALQAHGRD